MFFSYFFTFKDQNYFKIHYGIQKYIFEPRIWFIIKYSVISDGKFHFKSLAWLSHHNFDGAARFYSLENNLIFIMQYRR